MKSILHEEKFYRHNYNTLMSNNNVIINVVKSIRCDQNMINAIDGAYKIEHDGVYMKICTFCRYRISDMSYIKKNTYSFHISCANPLVKIKNKDIFTNIYVDWIKKEVYDIQNSNNVMIYDGTSMIEYYVYRGYIQWTNIPRSLYIDLRTNEKPIINNTMCQLCKKSTNTGFTRESMEYCMICYTNHTKLKRNLIHKFFILQDIIISDIVNLIIRDIIDILDNLH